MDEICRRLVSFHGCDLYVDVIMMSNIFSLVIKGFFRFSSCSELIGLTWPNKDDEMIGLRMEIPFV